MIVNKGTQHSTPTLDTTYVPSHHYDGMIWDADVMAPMRDGVHLCADVYRPKADGKFPALLAIAGHNKDLQTPD
jgi:predicted acyl esterase